MRFRFYRPGLSATQAPSWAAAFGVGAAVLLSVGVARGAGGASPAGTLSAAAVPVVFEENVGQTDNTVRFLVRQGNLTAWLTSDEIVFGLGEPGTEFSRARDLEPRGLRDARAERPSRLTAVRMRLVGANSRPRVEGLDPLPGLSNYLIGNDPTQWRTGVRHYARVIYRDVYPGIDLVVHAGNGTLEYDFELRPGADETKIELTFEGMDRAVIDEQGDLVLRVPGGDLRHRRPNSVEGWEAGRRSLETRFTKKAPGRFGFEVANRDRGRELRIDPEVVWERFPGTENEWGYDIAVDSEGDIYATGITWSVDFPRFDGMPPVNAAEGDAFVIKLHSDLSIVHTSFFGNPAGWDAGRGIDVNALGEAIVAGKGSVAEVEPAHPGLCAPGTGSGAFLAKLAADGASFEYATCLPAEAAWAVALHASGGVTVAGEKADDVFLARYNPVGERIFTRAWGGSSIEVVTDVALDTGDQAIVVGQTRSSDLPNTAAGLQQERPLSGRNGFVVKFLANGSPEVATYLGGTGATEVLGVAVDSDDDVYVTGTTDAFNFPIKNAARGILRDSPWPGDGWPWDPISTAFLTKLEADLDALVYSTFYVQEGLPIDGRVTVVDHEEGRKVVVDEAGNAYLIGMAQTFNQQNYDSESIPWLAGFNAYGWPGESAVFDVTSNNGDEFSGIALGDNNSLSIVGDVDYVRVCEWIPGQGQHCYDASDSDLYVLRIEDATEWLGLADESERERPCISNPVNIYTGNTWLDQVDTVIPGPGRGISFVRSYNSLNALEGRPGPLGPGWSHTYVRSLEEFPSGKLELRRADGVPMMFSDPDADGIYTAVTPLTETSLIEKVSGGGFTWRFRQGGSEGFDDWGRLISLVDADGVATTLGYEDDRLVSVGAGGSREIELDYDDEDRIIELTGPLGQIATYTYGASGHLATVSYPDGTGYSFTYDGGGQLLMVRDAAGTVVESHEYAGHKCVTSEISGGVERYRFSYAPGQTTITDALGHTTTWEWTEISGMKVPTSRIGPCASCGGTGDSEEWVYYGDGRLQTYRDALNRETTFTYNPKGDLETVRDPLDRLTTYTYIYDESGAITEKRRTAPGTGETVWSYDGDKLTQLAQQVTEAPTWRTTSFSYQGGRLEAVTAPDGKRTSFTYSGEGDLFSVTEPNQDPTTFAYDDVGRATKTTEPAGGTTRREYDVRGRVQKMTGPDGASTRFEYDTPGRLRTATDALGRTTRYSYDSTSRLVGVIDPTGATTATAYDLMSRTAALTDGEGHTTQFARDSSGRMMQTTYAEGPSESFTYYPTGLLWTSTDRKGVTTTYEYDDGDRLERKLYSDGTPEVTYGYDDADRLLSVSNGTDTLTWTYNLAGDVLTETSARAGTTVSYGYDAAGRRRWMDLDGVRQAYYGYDSGGRPSTITAGSWVFEIQYDQASRRENLDFPNGVTTSFAYDELSRLTGLEVAHGTTVLVDLKYDHDRVGNRTSKEDIDLAESFGYDRAGRLEIVDRSAPIDRHERYGYDRVGNRVSEVRDGTIVSAPHDRLNRLEERTGGGGVFFRGELDEPGTVTIDGQPAQMTSAREFELGLEAAVGTNEFLVEGRDASANVGSQRYRVDVAAASTTYDYDVNGNLITKVDADHIWTYEWNAENKLTRVSRDGAEVATFAYDPLGRRVEKAADGMTRAYVYDGIDIFQETISNGVTTTAYRYIHGPGIDEPLARNDVASGALSYYHADGLGSIVKVTDQAGAVVHSYRYDAWGNLEVGASRGGYAFTGREWDPETGLYYYRARYYDPEVGRFISEDPVRSDGAGNYFGYVLNRPTTFIDPEGLEIRAYSKQNAFGIRGLNHAWVYSTETGTGKGTAGSSWITSGTGEGPLDDPYYIVTLPESMSEAEFMDAVDNADGWNNWVWFGFVNDCHSDLENAFEQAGVEYPGVPNGRMNYDDASRDFGDTVLFEFKKALDYRNWLRIRFP